MIDLVSVAASMTEGALFVFPVVGKTPCTPHGFHDAVGTSREAHELFVRYPNATGIGIDCGRSGLLVVDIDGSDAEVAWAELERGHPHIPTLEAGTGRLEGGRHVYFRSTDARSKNSVGKVGSHIDTRGRGGFAIVPPSLHHTGNRYRWLNRRPIAPAPEWLLELIKPPAPTIIGQRRTIPPGERCDTYGRVALERQCDDMLNAPEGTRHDTLAGVAYRAGRLAAAGHLERSLAEAVLIPAARSTGLPELEVTTTFRDCFEAGLEVPVATGATR
jgi:hypothetical protein